MRAIISETHRFMLGRSAADVMITASTSSKPSVGGATGTAKEQHNRGRQMSAPTIYNHVLDLYELHRAFREP